jgi:hypothetical protein
MRRFGKALRCSGTVVGDVRFDITPGVLGLLCEARQALMGRQGGARLVTEGRRSIHAGKPM